MQYLSAVARRNASNSLALLLKRNIRHSVRTLAISTNCWQREGIGSLQSLEETVTGAGSPSILQYFFRSCWRLWYGIMPIKMRYGIATRYHIKDIHELMLSAFRVSEPTTRSIGPTRDEVYNFYHDLTVLNCKSEKYSTVVYHKQRLIAFSLCDVKNLGDIKEPSEQIDVNYYDFAQKIRDGPYEHHKANQLLVFSETLEQKRKQLHGNSAKVMYIDVAVVDKDYRRCGIANELVEKAVKLARSEGCDWVSACATSAASQELLRRMNFKTLYEIPYASFREKGKPVFINLDDSCDAGRYMGLQLK